MFYKLQPNFVCENCIVCGSRPVVGQKKHTWTVKCPNAKCNNAVTGTFADFETWNRKNKPVVSIKNNGDDEDLKKSV